MSRSGAEIKESESQSKFIQDRITAVEKHFGEMCGTFSSYTRKTARLRDKGDQVSKDILSYIEGETLNPSSKQNLAEFSHTLSTVQDYRNAQVSRLEAKVQHPLSNYGLKCKHTKTDLKAAFSARDREQKLRKKLDIARTKGDTRLITQLETDLQKASVDASRTTKNLEQQMDKFELEKLQDIKKIITDFVTIEMSFHAKALEVYSQCFQSLNNISIDTDIKEFRAKMKPSSGAARMNMARAGSTSSVSSNNSYENTPRADLQATPVRQTPQRATNGGVGNMMDDDDDDDSEEYDDDDESYEEETETETERTERGVPNIQPVRPAPRR